MDFMLCLPIDLLAKYADPHTIHFCENEQYVEQALIRAENYKDDYRKEDPTSWEVSRLGSWAYMHEFGAERFKPRWKICIERFKQDKRIRAREFFKHPELHPSAPPLPPPGMDM